MEGISLSTRTTCQNGTDDQSCAWIQVLATSGGSWREQREKNDWKIFLSITVVGPPIGASMKLTVALR